MSGKKDAAVPGTAGRGCGPGPGARRGRAAEDLTGRVFGYLTVLRRAPNKGGRTCWLCRCECGREKEVISRDMKNGKVKSCGCHRHDSHTNWVDLSGRRFGRLTAIEPTEQRDRRGGICWKCICDCGNETVAAESDLVRGNSMSCGCLRRENQQMITSRLHRDNGTCVEFLEKRKYRRDNSSGFRGVFRMKNGRYRAYIGFKGKRFYLGTFEKYEDAVSARLEAEETVHDGFLETYYRWKEKADADQEWKESHPLVFEVAKENGCLVISRGTG